MDLIYQTHSPYARKTLVVAHELGLADRLRVIHQETSPTNRNDRVYAINPLGKAPVLVLHNGEALFDSVVISDYLDDLAGGGKLIPRSGSARWAALRAQALAQGICEAGIALRWETVRRPAELRYAPLRDGMTIKLIESYDYLESSADFDAPLHVGHIALATALDWLLFRELPDFRDGRPKLTRWFDEFKARPSMQATQHDGETQD